MSDQRTVLIIDDSQEDRETYRRYLLQDKRHTYRILEEEEGENGLELCSRVQLDAILLDFMLPDIDGLEFLNELQSQIGTPNLPVVMLTGQGNEAIAVQAMKNGAQDYLVKGNTTPEILRLAVHNVLERSHLLRQLEQSEARFRTSVETMLDCFGIYKCIRNPAGQIVDFLIEYVNPAACADNNLRQEDQIGQRLLALLPFYKETGLFEAYCQVVETGEPLFKEALLYTDTHDQTLTKAFDVRAAKLGDGLVAAWRDMTEKKYSEEQLHQKQLFIQRIADTTPDILYLFDLVAQKNIYINRQTAEVLNYSPEEIQAMGTQLHNHLMHPEDLPRLADYLKQFESTQDGEILEFEYRMQHANGDWRWFNSRDTVFARSANGLPEQILGIAQDITGRRQIEVERSQLLAQEQAARLAAEAANRAKDEFLSMVSHELRNPLSAILGYTQLLQTQNLNEAKAARALKTIEHNAKLQSQLINDLLDLSRITSGKFHLDHHPISLISVIRAAIETVHLGAHAKAIQINTALDPTAATVMGDANRLQQVIWNLLTNAIKFTPEAGQIQIQLGRVEEDAQITVSDTGQGISADFLPYVFDRFRQADSTGKQGGLGLGLAIVLHLVELHQGTVQVSSPGPGQGANFTIRLPLVDHHNQDSEPRILSASGIRAQDEGSD